MEYEISFSFCHCCYCSVISKLIRLLQRARESIQLQFHILCSQIKKTEVLQISRHKIILLCFICIRIYPSGLHLEPKPKVLKDHNKGCFPLEFLAHRKWEALVISQAPVSLDFPVPILQILETQMYF